VNNSISVIIPSYSIERFNDIKDLVYSALIQKDPVELVFVVERNKQLADRLQVFLKDVGCNYKIIFSNSRLGLANARNVGIENSSGQYIAFVDDDAILSPNWSKALLDAFDRYPAIAGCTGPVIPKWASSEYAWFPKSFYWMIGCTAWRDFGHERLVDHAPGVNMVFRKDAIGGKRFIDKFTDGAGQSGKAGLVGDDLDFVIRLISTTGQKILYSPSIAVFHKVPAYRLRLSYLKKYAFWQAVAEVRYDKLYGSKHRAESRKLFFKQLINDILYPSTLQNFAKRTFIVTYFLLFSIFGYSAARFLYRESL